MSEAATLVELTRGPFIESVHQGHAVVMRSTGEVVESWGDPVQIVLPRSSSKMLQALTLVESGAAKTLSDEHLALACASHSGETRHVDRVGAWLTDLGLSEEALACGPQASRDRALRHQMIRDGRDASRVYNNCSGKHAGFLTLAQHLGAGLDYVDPDHPVQQHVRASFEDMCDEVSPGFGVDGCSAPNFAASLKGVAHAMARFSGREAGVRGEAIVALREAMMAHPELVSGKGRACAALMQAARGKAAVKTGAEGFFVAILPDLEMGVALKIDDGATRASEVVMAGILARLGVVDPADPVIAGYLNRPIKNWDGLVVGEMRSVLG